MSDTYYGVPDSELRSLLTSECIIIEDEVNKFKRRIKMDGHYVSNDALEEIIREAEAVSKVFYRSETIDELRPQHDKLLHRLYEIRHDSSNFMNKYG